MSMMDTLRNGIKFMLMSMGISSPAKKKPAPTKPVAKL
jgi:hypothetical protein